MTLVPKSCSARAVSRREAQQFRDGSVTRPFVDRPITDRGAADAAAIVAARHWVLDEPSLLRVGMNAIYRSGDTADDLVLRVSAPSAPAESAVELATFLAEQGLTGGAASSVRRGRRAATCR